VDLNGVVDEIRRQSAAIREGSEPTGVVLGNLEYHLLEVAAGSDVEFLIVPDDPQAAHRVWFGSGPGPSAGARLVVLRGEGGVRVFTGGLPPN
jgi:hypothetical protein